MPATAGPANIASSINGISISEGWLLTEIPPGPLATIRMPPHEMTNARTK